MRRAVVFALALLLANCGGGSGGGDGTTSAVTALPRSIDFGYYGTGEGQIAATADHVSFVHIVDWGGEAQMIAWMQEARARGVDAFVLNTGFLTFDGCNWLGTAALSAFKLRLDALDLSRSVWMLYPKDEPDVAGCSGAVMSQAYQATKAAWNVRIGVIYGDTNRTPGIDQATDVGRDKYGFGPQVLDLRADQRLMLIAGGADPYREDPQPYVDYAKSHPNVSVVWAFLHIPYTGVQGEPEKGIGTNGMLAQYRAAGCTLTRKC